MADAPRYDRILVPLDGSTLADEAIPHAHAVAKLWGARVVLVRVVPPLAADDLTVGFRYGELMETQVRRAETWLAAKARELADAGIAVDTLVRAGDPAMVIVDLLAELGMKLVIMATHGRSGVSRWVIGSVAERVLRAAPCPVLLVRVSAAAGRAT